MNLVWKQHIGCLTRAPDGYSHSVVYTCVTRNTRSKLDQRHFQSPNTHAHTPRPAFTCLADYYQFVNHLLFSSLLRSFNTLWNYSKDKQVRLISTYKIKKYMKYDTGTIQEAHTYILEFFIQIWLWKEKKRKRKRSYFFNLLEYQTNGWHLIGRWEHTPVTFKKGVVGDLFVHQTLGDIHFYHRKGNGSWMYNDTETWWGKWEHVGLAMIINNREKNYALTKKYSTYKQKFSFILTFELHKFTIF